MVHLPPDEKTCSLRIWQTWQRWQSLQGPGEGDLQGRSFDREVRSVQDQAELAGDRTRRQVVPRGAVERDASLRTNSLPPGGNDGRRIASAAKLLKGVDSGLSGDRCVAGAETEGSQAAICDDRYTGLAPGQIVRKGWEGWSHQIDGRHRDGNHLVIRRGNSVGKTPRGSAPRPGDLAMLQ